MYRIAVLTDLKHEGEHYAKVINDYCINQKLFPLLETYQNEYSCAVTPQVRQTGNRLSGLAGTAYASLFT